MNDIVLLTGGLGYVGGRIAQTLSHYPEFSLRISTRQLEHTHPAWLKMGNIVLLDLMSDNELDMACNGVRYIIHLAAMNEIDSALDPEQALIVNSLGTLKLLRAAERAGVERFIYFSTAHVYGTPLEGLITEETLPRPIHPYAITHRMAEDFVLAAHEKRKIDGIVVRLSNGIGAPISANVNRWTLVANELCRQAVTEKKLLLRSSGSQTRDFIALSDVSRAVVHFLKMPSAQCINGIFNLGGKKCIRIIDLAELISDRCLEILGFKPPIYRPDPLPIETSGILNYRIDKLEKTYFTLSGSIQNEIDSTLRLCVEAFGS